MKRTKLALVALLAVVSAFAAGNVLPTLDVLAPLTSRDRYFIIASFEQFAGINRTHQTLMERAGLTSAELYFRGRAEAYEEASELVLTWPPKDPAATPTP